MPPIVERDRPMLFPEADGGGDVMKGRAAPAKVLIVGGGGTGAAVAHDLALPGLAVILVERGELTSGTTGRHHGLLHSGARYAVNDQESAVECIEENARGVQKRDRHPDVPGASDAKR